MAAIRASNPDLMHARSEERGYALRRDPSITGSIGVVAMFPSAQGLLDKGLWEFNDLRARLTALSRDDELAENDLFRPATLAEQVLQAWSDAGLSLGAWRVLEDDLVRACAAPAEGIWRELNQWLVGHGVMPEVDLRHAIRRTEARSTSPAPLDLAEAPGAPAGPSSQTGEFSRHVGGPPGDRP